MNVDGYVWLCVELYEDVEMSLGVFEYIRMFVESDGAKTKGRGKKRGERRKRRNI
jgi:hypothetical protein